MANTARDRKYVPDRVKIPDLLYRVENHADRVENSAADQKPQAPRVHYIEKRTYRKDYHPAHCDIAHDGGLAEPLEVDGVKHYSYHRRAPHNAEQHPADRAAEN